MISNRRARSVCARSATPSRVHQTSARSTCEPRTSPGSKPGAATVLPVSSRPRPAAAKVLRCASVHRAEAPVDLFNRDRIKRSLFLNSPSHSCRSRGAQWGLLLLLEVVMGGGKGRALRLVFVAEYSVMETTSAAAVTYTVASH